MHAWRPAQGAGSFTAMSGGSGANAMRLWPLSATTPLGSQSATTEQQQQQQQRQEGGYSTEETAAPQVLSMWHWMCCGCLVMVLRFLAFLALGTP